MIIVDKSIVTSEQSTDCKQGMSYSRIIGTCPLHLIPERMAVTPNTVAYRQDAPMWYRACWSRVTERVAKSSTPKFDRTQIVPISSTTSWLRLCASRNLRISSLMHSVSAGVNSPSQQRTPRSWFSTTHKTAYQVHHFVESTFAA